MVSVLRSREGFRPAETGFVLSYSGKNICLCCTGSAQVCMERAGQRDPGRERCGL